MIGNNYLNRKEEITLIDCIVFDIYILWRGSGRAKALQFHIWYSLYKTFSFLFSYVMYNIIYNKFCSHHYLREVLIGRIWRKIIHHSQDTWINSNFPQVSIKFELRYPQVIMSNCTSACLRFYSSSDTIWYISFIVCICKIFR